MRFKVEDRVRIRRDLKPNTQYGSLWTNRVMTDLAGSVKTISYVSVNNTYYVLEEDGYSWSDEMLEATEEEEL